MLSPMIECLDYPLTIDGPIEMTFIDFAGKCESDGCRKGFGAITAEAQSSPVMFGGSIKLRGQLTINRKMRLGA
jgi:hypothetical protein